eukprot:scaffold17722_cov34-Phaeocystis_antarctica.AAC.1
MDEMCTRPVMPYVTENVIAPTTVATRAAHMARRAMLSAASAESDRGSTARGVDLGSGYDSVCTVTGAAGFFGPSELVHSEL